MYQGTTSEAAEKLLRVVGRGLIPSIKANGINAGFAGCGKYAFRVARSVRARLH
jgi:hypothetical protein